VAVKFLVIAGRGLLIRFSIRECIVALLLMPIDAILTTNKDQTPDLTESSPGSIALAMAVELQ